MRKNGLELFTDALVREASLEDYIDHAGRMLVAFPQSMTPDFLADEEPENIYGIEDYIKMRKAQKSAADVAWELYKLRGTKDDDDGAISLTTDFVALAAVGHAFAQDKLDALVAAYGKLSKVFNGAKKHDMDVVDFIDMVLVELAQLAMRGAA